MFGHFPWTFFVDMEVWSSSVSIEHHYIFGTSQSRILVWNNLNQNSLNLIFSAMVFLSERVETQRGTQAHRFLLHRICHPRSIRNSRTLSKKRHMMNISRSFKKFTKNSRPFSAVLWKLSYLARIIKFLILSRKTDGLNEKQKNNRKAFLMNQN